MQEEKQKLILPTDEEVDKYDYKRFGCSAKRVGQAVADIIKKDNPTQTVGETLEALSDDYAKAIEQCIEANREKLKSPFYIFVLTKKEFWAENVVRNWFVARQTPPYAFQTMEEYPHHTKTLYLVDAQKGKIKLVWSLPGFEDCITVAKNPHLYSPELVRWIEKCFTKQLDLDMYIFDSDV